MNETTKSPRTVTTPDWFTKGSIYQINPRTFSAEGTINAVTKELPFLKELGFTVMYLCPIFEEDDSTELDYRSPRQMASETGNPKNPYRMNDYFKIDTEYGTMDDLRNFIDEAHRLGMKVMLDLVYLHIGPNAPILKKHPDYAKRDENGNPVLTRWNFPYLNFESDGLREYLWSNMAYYIGAIDADGFRCDVGDKVPLDFWIEGRRRIRAIKPDAVLLNEGKKADYLEQAFDASYHFAWHEAVYSTFRNEATAADVRKCHEEYAAILPSGSIVMHDIDNHDTVTDWPERTELSAGHDGMELIEVLNYTLDGVPMVYCGNELADTAYLSMFANRFHVGKFETTDRTDKASKHSLRRQSVIRSLNALKHTSDVLCTGKTVWLDNTAPEQVLSFARVSENERILFIGNLSDAEHTVSVNGITLDSGELLLQSIAEVTETPSGIHLPPHGYALLLVK